MVTNELIRAWKDEEYRLGLSEAELSLLQENPAGSLELTDVELELVDGGGCQIATFNFVGQCWAVNIGALLGLAQQNQVSGVQVNQNINNSGSGSNSNGSTINIGQSNSAFTWGT